MLVAVVRGALTLALESSSDSVLRIETLNEREAVKLGLEEVMSSVQTEINDLRYTPLRLQNQAQLIARLPPEILGLIFEEACFWREAGESPEDAFDIGLRRTRQAVCSTCFHWRDVAVRHPRLWSTITVTYRKKRRLVSTEQLAVELARAGNHPLSLRIRTGQVIWGSNRTGPLLAKILAADPSYEVLHLHEHGANSVTLDPLVNRALGSPMIKSLAITWPRQAARGLKEMPEIIDLRNMTSLHSLHLAFHRPHKMRFQHQEASSVLTRLRLLGDMDLPSCIGLIDSCNRLESLYFNPTMRIDPATDPDSLPLFSTRVSSTSACKSDFRYLRHLHISGSLEHIELILRRDLTFSNLAQLRLMIDHPASAWLPSSAIFWNHHARFPNLRVLELALTRDTRTPNDLIIAFLRAHPKLEEVCLSLVEDLAPEMAQCLGGAPSPSPSESPDVPSYPLPNLRALGLYLNLATMAEPAHFGEILQLRDLRGGHGRAFAMYYHTDPRMIGPDHALWTVAAECGPDVTLKEEHYATTWAAEKNDNWWR